MNTCFKIPMLALICLALFLQGCKTVDGERVPDIERIARVTKEAATIGTQEVLARRPEWLPGFRIAHAELVALSQADNIDIDQILDIMGRLPVDELKSDNARLAIQGARLVISAIDVPEIQADKLAQLRPIVVALHEGIKAGGGS